MSKLKHTWKCVFDMTKNIRTFIHATKLEYKDNNNKKRMKMGYIFQIIIMMSFNQLQIILNVTISYIKLNI